MSDLFISILGKPFGIVLFQLLEATQYTIYLTLIAFFGGGFIGAIITLMHVGPKKILSKFAKAYIWLFQSTPLLMMFFLLGLGVPRLLGCLLYTSPSPRDA